MLFKPNFCCNCGTRIERADWGLLTSRRFCEVCAVENKEHDWLPRVFVAAAALMGVFGLGAFMGSPGRSEPALLRSTEKVGTGKIAVGADQQSGIKPQEPNAPGDPNTALLGPTLAPVSGSGTNSQPESTKAGREEPVYFCGAMTKKGKPCSRRVRSKGRCWQHKGQPSALASQSPPNVY
ncbi:MAG: hypothetical protein AB7F88_10025 [Pyrinomonadaceae bacterium]